MKNLAFALCLLAGPAFTGAAFAGDADDIRQVLVDQDAAWNEGDIEAFMLGYWNSDDLRFASGGTVLSGWQATLDRYLARYDTRAKMGTLSFSDLDIDVFSEDAASVFGRYHLTRPEEGDATGLFTLIMRKMDGKWVIVHDHTSADE